MATRRRRRNVQQGFMVKRGRTWVFHPVRASDDYSPKRAGEKRKRKPVSKKRKRLGAKRSNPGAPSGWIKAKAVKVTRLPGGGVNVKVKQ